MPKAKKSKVVVKSPTATETGSVLSVEPIVEPAFPLTREQWAAKMGIDRPGSNHAKVEYEKYLINGS